MLPRPAPLGTLPALLLAVLLSPPAARAQSDAASAHPAAPPEVAARRASAVAVDGRLDEAEWAAAPAATNFRQREPREGEPATQRTEVRFLFDDDALYIGARMHDHAGAEGVRPQLARRDAEVDGDYLSVSLDTYHDHLNSVTLRVNPSGVKGDGIASGGGLDYSWDPIWEAASRVDSLGWTAEMRIPFSQLRFATAEEQTWGVQVTRQVARLNEVSHWSFHPRTDAGGPSRFGHLAGLHIRRAPGRLELLPYAVAQSADQRAAAPAPRAHDRDVRAGLDLRYLLTSNLTLAATLNPDFGQVEVDPAQINLSDTETFYQERRPFFVEGSGYFGFSPFWCHSCSNVSSLGLFYSRRIGRAPQGTAIARAAGRLLGTPDNTAILGAAKITGKTRGGWSLALLNAVTQAEEAAVLRGSDTLRVAVEPRTNYLVGRVKRDLRGGDWVVGGMATSTLRDLGDAALAERLSRHAESVGVDAEGWWGKRTYHFLFGAAATQVAGDPEAMARIQQAPQRYFQRPDREHGSNGLFSDAYDPGATMLRGWGMYTRLAKDAGSWRWEALANVRSPGFENNDIAFLWRTDYAWLSGNLSRRFTVPTRWYRQLNLQVGAQQQHNFDGDLTDRMYRASVFLQLPNFWNLALFHQRFTGTLDDRLTRGGPAVRTSGEWLQWAELATDSRRPVSLSGGGYYGEDGDGLHFHSASLNLRYRPAPNVSLAAGPAHRLSSSAHQYVTAVDDPTAASFFGRRYVFAGLRQRTVSMETRANVTFTPTLSVELFAQPYVSSGEYRGFREFAAPRRSETWLYGREAGVITRELTTRGARYRVDPDAAGPAAPFTFAEPDFNFRSLRGNAVLRWEYRPGSTLFLVWQQDRSDRAPVGDLRLGRDRDALFAARPSNVFLIKMNYWVGG